MNFYGTAAICICLLVLGCSSGKEADWRKDLILHQVFTGTGVAIENFMSSPFCDANGCIERWNAPMVPSDRAGTSFHQLGTHTDRLIQLTLLGKDITAVAVIVEPDDFGSPEFMDQMASMLSIFEPSMPLDSAAAFIAARYWEMEDNVPFEESSLLFGRYTISAGLHSTGDLYVFLLFRNDSAINLSNNLLYELKLQNSVYMGCTCKVDLLPKDETLFRPYEESPGTSMLYGTIEERELDGQIKVGMVIDRSHLDIKLLRNWNTWSGIDSKHLMLGDNGMFIPLGSFESHGFVSTATVGTKTQSRIMGAFESGEKILLALTVPQCNEPLQSPEPTFTPFCQIK